MIKIKKIITAINNPNLNDKLKMENNIEIVCKDLQYKDAILDTVGAYVLYCKVTACKKLFG